MGCDCHSSLTWGRTCCGTEAIFVTTNGTSSDLLITVLVVFRLVACSSYCLVVRALFGAPSSSFSMVSTSWLLHCIRCSNRGAASGLSGEPPLHVDCLCLVTKPWRIKMRTTPIVYGVYVAGLQVRTNL